ncbi:hypothetical protein S23_56510 [Bradyrhizobium cosmicum]|uniref:Uncharacterized protein n=1 Tax=Bradyrhizobium cosmicum TaxID=1404864 RepID=A0AAI8MJ64_9BRAD|nr:hypothetical protein S23_56510 [Bradyrhizobium cosmicum]
MRGIEQIAEREDQQNGDEALIEIAGESEKSNHGLTAPGLSSGRPVRLSAGGAIGVRDYRLSGRYGVS